MQDTLEYAGRYAVTSLADRLVPAPRDNESLYTLCRAWVRNNPNLPLALGAASSAQRDDKDLAGAAAAPLTQTPGLDGSAAPNTSNGDGEQAQGQVQEQRKHQPPPEAQGRDTQQPDGGLLSILPPLLPPTVLETETSAPTYPLDDWEPQEAEDAQRKLKDHWVSVRQYHQAISLAKRSRCGERLRVLLGEPSSLQPNLNPLGLGLPPQMSLAQPQLPAALMAGAAAAAQNPGLQAALIQQQQQQLASGLVGQMGQASLAGHSSVGGLGGLPMGLAGLGGFPGGLLLPGPGQQGLPGGSSLAMQGGAGGGTMGGVSAAEAQAALAVLASLGQLPVFPTGGLDGAAQAQAQQAAGQLGQQMLSQGPPQPQPSSVGGPVDTGSQEPQQQLGLLMDKGAAPLRVVQQQSQSQPQPQQNQQEQPQPGSQQQPPPEDQVQRGQSEGAAAAGVPASTGAPDGAETGTVASGLPAPEEPGTLGETTAAAAMTAAGAADGISAGGGPAEPDGVERMDVDSGAPANGAQA